MSTKQPYVEDAVEGQRDSGSDEVVNEKADDIARNTSIVNAEQVHQLVEKLGDRQDGVAPE